MDFAPISNEREDQQYRGDQKQARGFGRVHAVPVMLVGCVLLGLWSEHADIVAPR